MSNSKISELPSAGPLADTDLLAIVQGTSPDLVTNKISFKDLTTGVSKLIELTVADLNALITSGSLIPGAIYKLSDFQTKHLIPNTTSDFNVAEIEILYVWAITNTKVSTRVFSEAFPQDIIYLDLTNTVCEDVNHTPRKGKIIYRKDTLKNLETWYDFRNVVFRRWQLDEASNPGLSWQTSHSYSVGDVVIDNGIFYQCLYDHTSSTLFDSTSWIAIGYCDTGGLYSAWDTSISQGSASVNANTSVNTDYLTFSHTDCENISLRPTYDGSYNNIVFLRDNPAPVVQGFTTGENCKNFTVINTASQNRFEKDCNSIMIKDSTINEIGNNGSELSFFDGSTGNILGNSCSGEIFVNASYNCFGSNCSGNILVNANYNSFGNNCSGNLLGNTINDPCNSNSFGNDCYNNALYGDNSGNMLANGCYDNRFGQGSNGNTLDNFCHSNNICYHTTSSTGAFSYNRLGANCSNLFIRGNNNVFGEGCSTIDINAGAYCYFCPGVQNKTFQGVDLFGVRFEVPDQRVVTYSNIYLPNIIIDKISDDGSGNIDLWYTTIDSAGTITQNKFV